MEKLEAAIKLENYMKKNRNYLKMYDLEDAFQTTSLYILSKIEKGEILEINDSYISKGIKWAKNNEIKDMKNVMGIEDLKNEYKEYNIEELYGYIDKKIESVIDKIEIEEKISAMAAKDEKVKDVVELFIQGYNINEISEKVLTSKSTVSRILNMKTKQERKIKRKNIDKTNLDIYKKIAKKYGIEKKYYIVIKSKKIRLDYGGRIFSKEDFFQGEYKNGEYVSYIDKVPLQKFEQVLSE